MRAGRDARMRAGRDVRMRAGRDGEGTLSNCQNGASVDECDVVFSE
jgi:hypothetical protein